MDFLSASRKVLLTNYGILENRVKPIIGMLVCLILKNYKGREE